MPMIINSPYNGRPVKIRDQDVGRALRDDEGHIFYAVARSDGGGYYGAPTRRGSEKDEQRYLTMETREVQARETGKVRSAAQIHDATGKRMVQLRRRAANAILLLVVVLLLLLLVVGGLAIYRHYAMPGSAPLPYWPTEWTPGGMGATKAAAQGVSMSPSLPRGAMNDVGNLAVRREAIGDKRQTRDFSRMRIAPVSEPIRRGEMSRMFLTLYGGHDHAQDMTGKAATPSRGASHVRHATRDAARHPLNVQPAAAWVTLGSGLKYRILKAGHGDHATAGKYVIVKVVQSPESKIQSPKSEVRSPESGTMDSRLRTMDSSTVGFVLWSGQRPRAWDLGIAGMRVGEKREVIVRSPESSVPADGPRTSDHGLGTMDEGLIFELVDVRPGVTRKLLKAATHEATRLTTLAMARPGDTISVRYRGYIQGVKQPFDVSHSQASDPPLTFVLGAGRVMPGWDLGIAGMKVGQTWELTIPPYLAYGKEGVGALIPAHATLRYVITLVGVKGGE